jgi:hypothetical protein
MALQLNRQHFDTVHYDRMAKRESAPLTTSSHA